MLERIPQRIDHYRYTDKGVTLDGVITQEESEKDMLRLHDTISQIINGIHYHLEFDLDKLGNRIVTGTIKTQVILQCQRCMEDYELEVECDVLIAFVHNEFEQKKAEDSSYEVVWLESKELFDPRVLIEDELMLALPQIPMHPESEIGQTCQVHLAYSTNADLLSEVNNVPSQNKGSLNEESKNKESEQEDENNPFAILKQLKK